VPVGDLPDVVEQPREMVLGGLAAAHREGIDAGHAAAQFVHGLADRPPVPPEMGLRPDLSPSAHRLDRLGHEAAALAALEGLGGVDQDGDHLRGRPHLRNS